MQGLLGYHNLFHSAEALPILFVKDAVTIKAEPLLLRGWLTESRLKDQIAPFTHFILRHTEDEARVGHILFSVNFPNGPSRCHN